MEVNCSKKSERERKQKVFTSHLLQITLQQKAERRRRRSGMVQEQKAFLPRNAPRWELCLSQEFGFTSQTHPWEGSGGSFCSLMTPRLCPLAGQRSARRLKLQPEQNSFHIGV